uniref:Putative bifunctional DNA primase/polymerase n=1 Tax=viral metagenome TaxID=1070528 RepID=A0A6M3LPZ9_9ZZZZ
MIDHALAYHRAGLNVMPVKPDKKPYLITWAEYQTKCTTEDSIRTWWKTWPDANIAIITGGTSGIVVIDADSETGLVELDKITKNIRPTVKSPKGWHYYFRCDEPIGNAARFLPDCDIRGQGGYIVAPPSKNGAGGGYKLLEPIESVGEMPPALLNIINSSCMDRSGGPFQGATKAQQSATKRNISFEQGLRDESLFHVANCLVKGGMNPLDIEYCLNNIALTCNPPFPEKEIQAKVNSAIKRASIKNTNTMQEIRDLIAQQKGNITATFCNNAQQSATKAEKSAVRMALSRCVKEGLIEPTGRNAGEYRIVEPKPEPVDWKTAKEEWVKLYLPWRLDEFVKIPENGLILLMGAPNCGKSAALINIARYNMKKGWDVHYLSTEISEGAFRNRAECYNGLSLDDWKVNFYYDPPVVDTIEPGKKKLWLIDYIELYDKFWEVGKILADIHRKLGGGVAICAIQKQPGSTVGLGGQFTQFKPSLTLAMDWQKVKIVKAKDYDQMHFENYGNPNGKEYHFKMIDNRTRYKEERWWHNPFEGGPHNG